MINHKAIGLFLFGLAAYTVVGMLLENFMFWKIYNIVTIALCLIFGLILLRKR